MQLFLITIAIFSLCTVSLLYLHPLAIRVNFVDVPCPRKSHNGHIPLVGGLSTMLGVWAIAIILPELLPSQLKYTLFASLLVLVGLIDDKLDIKASKRLIVIAAVSTWLVLGEGIALDYLGNLVGLGEIYLGGWSLLFTMSAVIGCVTAFNMVDGIDGLLGALAAVAIGSMGFLFLLAGQINIATFCFLFIVSMLPYVCFNLGLKVKSRFKVFMGDSGCFLVGFTVIWLLVCATQNVELVQHGRGAMNPVTALWVIAIPLMDMAFVILKRLAKKKSPFSADRTHIHHVLLNYGYTPKQILSRVTILSVFIAVLGVGFDLANVAESTSFYLFLVLFIGYCSLLTLLQVKTSQRVKPIQSL